MRRKCFALFVCLSFVNVQILPAYSIPKGQFLAPPSVDLNEIISIEIEDLLDKALNGEDDAYQSLKNKKPVDLMTFFESGLDETIDTLPEGIFGFGFGYDIRGNALKLKGGEINLTPANHYLLGKLLGTMYAKHGDKVLITGDIRLHTPVLRYALVLGFASVGVDVDFSEDYFTTGGHNLLSVDGAGTYKHVIQLSGSHGVPEKNGIKIKTDFGERRLDPLYVSKLEKLYINRNNVKGVGIAETPGTITKKDGLLNKVVDILDRTLPKSPEKEISVIDSRAGAAGVVIKPLLKKRGYAIIDMDTVTSNDDLISLIGELLAKGNTRIAVMLNVNPDPRMGRGIWDPSKLEALEPTIELVKFINSHLPENMPRAFGAVFDCDTDRITAIKEDGGAIPSFEMTLPYYQRFLIDPKNIEAIKVLAKHGAPPIHLGCDVRSNSKLGGLIDRMNDRLKEMLGISDREIIIGSKITTGYPPILGFTRNRIAELVRFVDAHEAALVKEDPDFLDNFENLTRTIFNAEASGHNFFHISEKYPEAICDCAIAGFVTISNIRDTMDAFEAREEVADFTGVETGKKRYELVDLFNGFPKAFSSNEVRLPIANDIKIKTATTVGNWMKKTFAGELKPGTELIQEGDYFIQDKDSGWVEVSGFQVNLKDGRSATVRWSNTGEQITLIFEGSNYEDCISMMNDINGKFKEEGVDVANLEKEIKRVELEALWYLWDKLRAEGLNSDSMPHLKELIETPGRVDELTIKDKKLGMSLDLSKNRITPEILSLLKETLVASDFEKQRKALFGGELVNNTEGRAAAHWALRDKSGKVIVAGEDVKPVIDEVKAKMKTFTENVRTGKWVGHTGKKITDIVNIGIGGSDLGPRMAVEALEFYRDENSPRVHFVSNADPSDLARVLKGLDPETTLFYIVTKSWGTKDTIDNATASKDWLVGKFDGDSNAIAKHFVAISTNKDAVKAFGIDVKNMFPLWDWVGGRYSIWSAVGLSLATSIGFEKFEEFLDGAYEMDKHFQEKPLEENLPVLLALMSFWYTNFMGAQSELIMPYSSYLSKYTAYLQQLHMESDGKGVNKDGVFVDYTTGQIIWGTAGTDGQHSFMQLVHQEDLLIPLTFILFANPLDPIGTQHESLLANALAQSQALAVGLTEEAVYNEMIDEGMEPEKAKELAPHRTFTGNKPSSTLFVEKLTPRSLGSLIALSEQQVFTLSVLWRINPFDQWGVELGKKMAGLIEEALTGPVGEPTADASTKALIRTYREMNASQ